MASRLASRTAAHVARLASRAPRRGMAVAPGSKTAAKSSDVPWIVGSTVVFGGAAAYLLAPKGTDHAKHHGEAQVAHHEAPKTIPGFTDKSPSTPTPTTDDEGTEVPEQEVKDSMDKAYASNSPNDAGRAESAQAKGEDPTSAPSSSAEAAERAPSDQPGKDPAEAEGDVPVSDKGLGEKQKRSGTFQSPEEEGATKMGKARAGAAEHVAPREVAKE
ncbi:hypothetical protein GLOTRDRAFT_141208 [Gloeophyllum trabeum ATCC 11539]|uniref:Uncharacterized protein n=1 Tax=Gloeophyllum trabeum (strain ATCC 11539 / FP-39264 / Madison 617) TaxID=670483 RepID=S7R9Z4_GLOTA|nr:uncharacterized protein GLOTRDRAFT_141208 [Gloeophyllum trabeum ATCC 11539]EPQ51065.1 hypothetical protein GLOTRDRAFT_141208 [Gloeophyllum trabeum ATCC 11539]